MEIGEHAGHVADEGEHEAGRGRWPVGVGLWEGRGGGARGRQWRKKERGEGGVAKEEGERIWGIGAVRMVCLIFCEFA